MPGNIVINSRQCMRPAGCPDKEKDIRIGIGPALVHGRHVPQKMTILFLFLSASGNRLPTESRRIFYTCINRKQRIPVPFPNRIAHTMFHHDLRHPKPWVNNASRTLLVKQIWTQCVIIHKPVSHEIRNRTQVIAGHLDIIHQFGVNTVSIPSIKRRGRKQGLRQIFDPIPPCLYHTPSRFKIVKHNLLFLSNTMHFKHPFCLYFTIRVRYAPAYSMQNNKIISFRQCAGPPLFCI